MHVGADPLRPVGAIASTGPLIFETEKNAHIILAHNVEPKSNYLLSNSFFPLLNSNPGSSPLHSCLHTYIF